MVLPGGAGALDDDGQRPFQLARDAGQIRHERVGFLADDARLVERLAQPFNEVRLAQPLQRLLAFLRRERDDGRGLLLGLGQFGLRLLDRQQQFAHVALEQVRRQSRFLGGAFHEAAALHVPAQINLVQVEAFSRLVTQAQRDFQRVGADGFFQTAHAIFAAFHVEEPGFASLLQGGRRYA